MSYQIRTKEKYITYLDNGSCRHDGSIPAEELFDLDYFDHMTANRDGSGNHQFKVSFYTENGDIAQITQNQAEVIVRMTLGYAFDHQPGEVQSDNLYAMVRQFLPEDTHLTMIENKFYRTTVRKSSSFEQNFANFMRSKEMAKLVHIETKRIYKKTGEGVHDYIVWKDKKNGIMDIEATSDVIQTISDQYREEEQKEVGKTNTQIQRDAIDERTRNRLYEETGFEYDYTYYSGFSCDENARFVAQLMVPDLYDAYLKVIDECVPGSQHNAEITKSEATNPVAKTSTYKNSAKRSFNNFCELFHLTEDHLKGHTDFTYVVEQILLPVVHECEYLRGRITSEKTCLSICGDLYRYWQARGEYIRSL